MSESYITEQDSHDDYATESDNYYDEECYVGSVSNRPRGFERGNARGNRSRPSSRLRSGHVYRRTANTGYVHDNPERFVSQEDRHFPKTTHSPKNSPKSPIVCYRCGRSGHISRECYKSKNLGRDKEQVSRQASAYVASESTECQD